MHEGHKVKLIRINIIKILNYNPFVTFVFCL